MRTLRKKTENCLKYKHFHVLLGGLSILSSFSREDFFSREVCVTQALSKWVVMVTDTGRLTPEEDWMLNGQRAAAVSQRE